MGHMLDFIKNELELTKWNKDDKDTMLTIAGTFFTQWDSGGAVHAMIPVLHRLLCGQPLSPLTGEDSEWFPPVSDAHWVQNKRCASVFKTTIDMPKHKLEAGDAYDLNFGIKKITFPYLPKSIPNVPPPTLEIVRR